MPKEYIAGRGDVDDFRIKVGWWRDMCVQVATVNPDDDHSLGGGGLYVTLDRKGINDLIRVLRRARDQAFGRDE